MKFNAAVRDGWLVPASQVARVGDPSEPPADTWYFSEATSTDVLPDQGNCCGATQGRAA